VAHLLEFLISQLILKMEQFKSAYTKREHSAFRSDLFAAEETF